MSGSRCSLQWVLDDITSGRSGQQCVKPWAKHTNTNETIDFLSSFRPLHWAVDAATMLEAFHNYGQARYLIGKEQDEGSKKQRAAFMLAKWFFDTGDRVGLATSL